MTCPCPGRITDPQRHAAWHELVVEQGGPAGAVDVVSLSRARGHREATGELPGTPAERRRHYGRLRTQAIAAGRHGGQDDDGPRRYR